MNAKWKLLIQEEVSQLVREQRVKSEREETENEQEKERERKRAAKEEEGEK